MMSFWTLTSWWQCPPVLAVTVIVVVMLPLLLRHLLIFHRHESKTWLWILTNLSRILSRDSVLSLVFLHQEWGCFTLIMSWLKLWARKKWNSIRRSYTPTMFKMETSSLWMPSKFKDYVWTITRQSSCQIQNLRKIYPDEEETITVKIEANWKDILLSNLSSPAI